MDSVQLIWHENVYVFALRPIHIEIMQFIFPLFLRIVILGGKVIIIYIWVNFSLKECMHGSFYLNFLNSTTRNHAIGQENLVLFFSEDSNTLLLFTTIHAYSHCNFNHCNDTRTPWVHGRHCQLVPAVRPRALAGDRQKTDLFLAQQQGKHQGLAAGENSSQAVGLYPAVA